MKKHQLLIVALIVIVLALRIYFAFQFEEFSSDKAYFTLRQSEYIVDDGVPKFDDPLSYNGRTYIFMPGFQYVLALFGIFMPIATVAKIIPNIFAALLVVPVYLLSWESTKNRSAAFFSATLAGFIPIYFSSTFNSVSNLTLSIPLFFFLVYHFSKIPIDAEKYSVYFLIILILLLLITPLTIIIIPFFMLYFIIAKLEKIKLRRAEFEIMIFSSLFILWGFLLVFKKALLLHGPLILLQNIPLRILANYFKELTVLEALYGIGIIPFLAGLYVIYRTFFEEKNRFNMLYTCLAITFTLLLWLRLIPFQTGLILLGTTLVLLSASFYNFIISYVQKTKFARFRLYLIIVLYFLFIVTSVVTSFAISFRSESLSSNTVDALLWLKDNTDKSSVVLADVNLGHALTYYARRSNVVDSNFLLVRNLDVRLDDIEKIKSTPITTTAVSLLEKYDIDYILLSDISPSSPLLSDKCFKTVYNESVLVVESLCKLR